MDIEIGKGDKYAFLIQKLPSSDIRQFSSSWSNLRVRKLNRSSPVILVRSEKLFIRIIPSRTRAEHCAFLENLELILKKIFKEEDLLDKGNCGEMKRLRKLYMWFKEGGQGDVDIRYTSP